MIPSLQEQLNVLASLVTLDLIPNEESITNFKLQICYPKEIKPNFQLPPIARVVDKEFSVAGVLKNIRFDDFDLHEDLNVVVGENDVIGGFPIKEILGQLATGNIPADARDFTEGDVNQVGTPGFIGNIKGTIPFLETVTETTELPLSLQVRVRICDADDNVIPTTGLSWSEPEGTSGTGGEFSFLIPNFSECHEVNLDLVPIFRELTTGNAAFTGNTPSIETINLLTSNFGKIKISLRIVSTTTILASSDWVDLPELPLPIPQISMPTVAMFFQHPDFDGIALAIAPSTSIISVPDDILALLNNLIDVMQIVDGSFPPSFLLPDYVVSIRDAIRDSNIVLRIGDEIPKLDSIHLRTEDFAGIDFLAEDTDADNEFSSMLFIGGPFRQLQCYNAKFFNVPDEGQFNINLGNTGTDLAVQIPDMRNMISEPIGRVDIIYPHNNRWDDRMSSVRFDFDR